MKKVKFKDFRIVPDLNSIKNLDITDEEYFSPKYGEYISNSKLKLINPEQGGSPNLFKNPVKQSSQALSIGTNVHELLLQPELFELAPKIEKPGSKLGLVFDKIPIYLKEGLCIDGAIRNACKDADYYVNQIDKRIDSIRTSWNKYNEAVSKLNSIPGKENIILSDKDWDTVNGCVESCKNNEFIMSKLHPKDMFGDPIETHFEDALFIDFIVIYKNTQCAVLKFKLKIDNWTIDFDNKTVTLNDLKTTGHSVNTFMDQEMSFEKFHYSRQMAVYSEILWYYVMCKYGVTKDQGWKLQSNMLVVETIPNYWSRSFFVTDKQLAAGRNEFEQLMSRVCYAELFGYDQEVEFI